jgi:hypothetical protein
MIYRELEKITGEEAMNRLLDGKTVVREDEKKQRLRFRYNRWNEKLVVSWDAINYHQASPDIISAIDGKKYKFYIPLID